MKKLINAITVLAILGGVIYLTVQYGPSISPIGDRTTGAVPTPAPRQYSYAICDDAYKTDVRHDNETIEFFDVKLHDGCFSGYVGLPKNWQTYQGQLLHNDPSAWVAEWWSGWDHPIGPFTSGQLDSPDWQSMRVPSNHVRLQGRGTMRFYCTVGNCPSSRE
jgi:hypothetical protein